MMLFLLNDAASSVSLENLSGKWHLYRLHNKSVPHQRAYMEFGKDNMVNGNSGCNNFGGRFLIDGQFCAFKDLNSTQMACMENEYMLLEGEFYNALTETKKCHVNEGQLFLIDKNDKKIAIFKHLSK
jgi:heat shock protein HslJ